MIKYAIVSHDVRRDLQDPLRFFQSLKPIHFYQRSSYGDMSRQDDEGMIPYSSPIDLLQKLQRESPQIVQGGEPFVRRLIPYAWAVLRYSRGGRLPLVVPSLDNIPVSTKYGRAWAALVRASIRPYLRSASLAIAVNKGAEDNLLWGGARPERIVRMMYGTWGVDTEEFAPDGPKTALPGDARAIVFLGRVERAKGIFTLVAALPSVLAKVDTDLVVVGDGPDREAMKLAAQQAGVADHVHLLGRIKNREVASVLRSASLLVAPSLTTRRWAEQVGMSAIQAMACGIPVVSTHSGSIPEFVDDGISGLLVPEGDPDALGAAITRLMTNEAERLAFSHRARLAAQKRFDARTNIRAVEAAILAACGYAE